jgi:transcriptional regulator with XRE-family HTH domain
MAARRRLGTELRRLREASSFSGERAAAHFGWSQAKISRMEAAINRPTVRDVGDLLELYGTPPHERDELLALAAVAATREATWWTDYAGTISVRTRQRTALEAEAATLRHFQPNVIPGLLQTAEYARALFAISGVEETRMNIDLAVAFRAIRQEFVFQSTPSFQLVITGSALRWRPGSGALQKDQLHSLLEKCTKGSNVVLRVLDGYPRDSAYPQPDFTIYEFGQPSVPSVAYIEFPTGYTSTEDDRDIRYYQDTFQSLQESALDPDASIAYIEALIIEFEGMGPEGPRR